MMLWWMAVYAQAPEVVVVWQKSFARFDDKRWLVVSEIVTPTHPRIGTQARPMTAGAWQLETVVHCRMDPQRGALREADCEIEDAAIRVHNPRYRIGGKEEAYLQSLAEQLVGTNLQLQVTRRGPVPNHDLDGLREDNLADRSRAEGVRTMMGQVAAAFHMNFSKNTALGHNWVAYNEPLLLLATPNRGMGAMEVIHRLDDLDGIWVHQAKGRSTATAPLSNPNAGLHCKNTIIGDAPSTLNNPATGQARADAMDPSAGPPPGPLGTGVGAGLGTGMNRDPTSAATVAASETIERKNVCPTGGDGQPDQLANEAMYALDLDSVAVIDPQRGYPVERVWSVMGTPTAGSPGGLTATNYWSAGKLRELGAEEEVVLGPTGLIGPPGKKVEGLPLWVTVAD